MPTMIHSLDVSRGMILELDGSLYTILEYQVFKAGKGNSEARVRVKLRDLRKGDTAERTFRTDGRVPKATVDNQPAQFLYQDEDLFHFMDMETFEEKLLTGGVLGEKAGYLTDGLQVELLLYEGEPVAVQLPIIVDLRIREVDPGFKGDTAQASTKRAMMETGLQVAVPLFLNPGDVIRVDTRTGAYVGRAS